jgi:hypothetical protein
VGGYNALTGYPYYLAVNTYFMTWGFAPTPLPGGYQVFPGNVFLTTLWPGGENPYIIQLEIEGTEPGVEYFAALYLDASQFTPFYTSGIAAVQPAGVPPSTGYVFIGYIGPITNLAALQLDITDIVITLFGQYPNNIEPEPDQFRFYGGGLAMQVVLNNGLYGLELSEFVELPSPEVSFFVVPFTISQRDSVVPVGASTQRARLTPTVTRAKFYGSEALRARVNQTRRSRGDNKISRAQLRAGRPVAAFK